MAAFVRRIVRSNDRGVATVLACICVIALIALTGLVVQLAAAGLARHRAENAADLGALAGAAAVLEGEQASCERAAAVTAANGATVAGCNVQGADLLLSVTVSVRLGLLTGAATARARAGPAIPSASTSP